MSDAFSSPLPPTLSEADVRRGMELLYFGYANFIKQADNRLAKTPYGRAHHRALYFIARKPGLTVSDLLRLLDITKQSLGRVLGELQRNQLVEQKIGTHDRRERLLYLTPEGSAFEMELFHALRTGIERAYAEAGAEAVENFWAVLTGLLPDDVRADVASLSTRRD